MMFTGPGGYDKLVTLDKETSMWDNLFFISYFFITNLIFVNILVGFLCANTYTIMEEMMKKMKENKEESENHSNVED